MKLSKLQLKGDHSFKKTLWKLRLPIKLILLVSFLVIGYFLLSQKLVPKFFKIQKVEVQGNYVYVNPTDLNTLVQNYCEDKNTLQLDTQTFSRVIEDRIKYIKAVTINKVYPDKVVISFKERGPVAVFDQNGENFLLDSDGFVLGIVGSDGNQKYLKVSGVKNQLKVGEFWPGGEMPGITMLITDLTADSIQASELNLDSGSWQLSLKQGTEVLLDPNKNIQTSLNELKEVLLKYSLKSIMLKKVDLRYDNLVVEY